MEFVFFALGHDELPEQLSRFLVETHQYATVTLVLWIARVTVVCANVNAAVRHDRRRMRFVAQLCDPLDVPPRLWIEPCRQAPLTGNHVTRPGLSPLRLIGGG